MKKTVTCLKCGWVSIEVTRAYAEAEVFRVNKYLAGNNLKERSSIEHYEKCFFCRGSYQDFKDSTPADVASGHTLNPILKRDLK